MLGLIGQTIVGRLNGYQSCCISTRVSTCFHNGIDKLYCQSCQRQHLKVRACARALIAGAHTHSRPAPPRAAEPPAEGGGPLGRPPSCRRPPCGAGGGGPPGTAPRAACAAAAAALPCPLHPCARAFVCVCAHTHFANTCARAPPLPRTALPPPPSCTRICACLHSHTLCPHTCARTHFFLVLAS